ncbi:MAG: hypothetical protein GC134_08555 [Proteobacteria bacterium]|nr:hypothetical protein [Pseudomonadota bacterium]
MIAPVSPALAAQRCDLLPAYKEELAFDGHKTIDSKALRVFDTGDTSYTVQAPWAPLGTTLHDGCAKFPEGQSGVLINTDQYAKQVIKLPKAPFEIHLYTPETVKKPDVEMLVKKIETFNELIAPLFPKGFGENSEHPTFDWLVTTGAMRGGKVRGMNIISDEVMSQVRRDFGIRGDGPKDLLSPNEGPSLAVIDMPFDHPKLDEELIRDIIRLYTKVYPHPELGPKERQRRANLKIDFNAKKPELSLADYDALLAGWASLVYANNAVERNRQLYEKLLDTLGYLGDGDEKSQPIDQRLYGHKNTELATDWKGADNASPIDAYAFKHAIAPVMALQIEKALDDASAKETLKDLFIRVNNGDVFYLEKVLSEYLTEDEVKQVTSFPFIQNRNLTTVSDLMMEAVRRGYVDGVYPRPQSEELASMGGSLDARLYMKDPENPSRTVYVLSHGIVNRSMSMFVRIYDLLAMPLIKKLMDHGDVFVVQRYSYGETDAVPPEFLNTSCKKPRYLWGIRSSDQHFTNAAIWLKASGYEKIIGIANDAGSLPLMSAEAANHNFDELFLFDPWRAIGTYVCAPEELTRLMKGFMSKIKVPVHVTNALWLPLYGGHSIGMDMEKRMADIFPNNLVWLPKEKAPQWSTRWNDTEQYPDNWWPSLEKALTK